MVGGHKHSVQADGLAAHLRGGTGRRVNASSSVLTTVQKRQTQTALSAGHSPSLPFAASYLQDRRACDKRERILPLAWVPDEHALLERVAGLVLRVERSADLLVSTRKQAVGCSKRKQLQTLPGLYY